MTDYKLFQKYIDAFGSIYAAVSAVSKAARNIANKYDNVILHSEAITWVLTGERPPILERYNEIQERRKNPDIHIINEMLSYVDDKQVCECVKLSINRTKQNNHLIYIYKGISDENKKARVRILTRMIWYQIHEEQGE